VGSLLVIVVGIGEVECLLVAVGDHWLLVYIALVVGGSSSTRKALVHLWTEWCWLVLVGWKTVWVGVARGHKVWEWSQ